MKVALVCPYDWTYPGGVRTHVIGLASALERRGIGCEIIAPSSKPDDRIFVAGGTMGIPSNGSVARICFTPGAKARVAERVTSRGFDLLHLHEPLVPSIGLLALMTAAAPRSIATFHAAARGSLGYRLMRPVLKRYSDRVVKKIAVSRAARDFAGRYFPGEYRVIPNGVDTRRFRGAGSDQDLLALKPFVLFVGRPERRKGFDVLREAMRMVRRDHDVRLVTAGGAPPGEDSWIVPLGVVDDERLPSVFAAADVFCAPATSRESFGIVIAEAMASGVPVVAADIPGFAEAAGGAAVLVPTGDPLALAKAIGRVLGDPSQARRLRAAGLERAAALDWDVVSQEVVSVYEAALRG